jgi:hypothetical protein
MFGLPPFDLMTIQREDRTFRPGEEFPDQKVFIGVGQEVQKGIVGGNPPFIVLFSRCKSRRTARPGSAQGDFPKALLRAEV